jgi:putative sporulation protein YyaC
VRKPWDEILILCIGSDRVTGDCLGPLTGALLCRHTFPSVTVYGTLQEPVHACNLEKTLLQIKKRHPAALILAVDASLGNKKHLGYAAIANGALIPGAAVSKNLPPVGDVHITGIVNTAGCQEYLMLQTTRLANVLALSDNIAQGILLAMPAVLSGNLV